MRGIKIICNGDEIHTGKDLDLVQEVKEIGKPEIQSHIVEVPGRNGLLNLTKGLTGKVMYFNRELSFRYFGTGTRKRLLEIDALLSYYHGETVRIIDDDYPDHFYEGELSVESELHGNYITISLTVDAQPFRLKTKRTVYKAEIEGEVEITLINESIDAIPTITVTAETEITFNGLFTTISAGTYIAKDFVLRRGENIFTVSGTGEITFDYQEGAI